MPKVLTAKLKGANFSNEKIDADNGIISGVKIAQLGKMAVFEGDGGKACRTIVTPEKIKAFIDLAGNRTLPAHFTHDYVESGKDALHLKVGALKSFRRDGDGDLVADLHLSPGEYRDTILWNAKNDPTNMMMSPVFTYSKSDPSYTPIDFRGADLVEKGAATTALLAEFSDNNPNKNTPMDIQDFLTALDDPKVKDALKAIIKSHTPDAPDPADNPAVMDDSAAGEMEDAAGVTADDKKPEDDKKPALMRCLTRMGRVIARLSKKEIKLTADDETRIATLAEASFVKNVGTGKIQLNLGKGAEAKTATAVWAAKVSELKEAHGSSAASFAARAFPKEYQAMMKEKSATK